MSLSFRWKSNVLVFSMMNDNRIKPHVFYVSLSGRSRTVGECIAHYCVALRARTCDLKKQIAEQRVLLFCENSKHLVLPNVIYQRHFLKTTMIPNVIRQAWCPHLGTLGNDFVSLGLPWVANRAAHGRGPEPEFVLFQADFGIPL